jgi:hypothetical protein
MFRKISIVVLLLLSFATYAQKKKEIKKYRIRSVTTTEVENGKTLNDSKTIFDANGEVVEEINYDNKDGSLKSHHKYKVNSDGDVTEDAEYDKSGLKEKKTYKYNGLGEKTEELIYDRNEKLQKRHVYSYDGKGLKTERKTYDAANTLLSVKKYTYEYK